LPDPAPKLRLREVAADALAVARVRIGLLLVVIAVYALPAAVFDATLDPGDALRANSLMGFVALYLQLLLTSAALRHYELLPPDYDPRRPTMGRYPAAFGLSLIYCLAVGAGLVLLVLPGLVLILRWSVSLPVLLGERLRVTQSLGRSWGLTRGQSRPVLCLLALVLLSWLLPIAVMVFSYPDASPAPWGAALLANLMMGSALAAQWLLTAAVYHRLLVLEQAVRAGG